MFCLFFREKFLIVLCFAGTDFMVKKFRLRSVNAKE